MLNRIFCGKSTKSSQKHHAPQPKSTKSSQKNHVPQTKSTISFQNHHAPQPEPSSSALKIIYAGGAIEYYYMAVPAARIIEKNPSFILARPDVFRRPWDAVVQPEEMLIPGQKYYIVPLSTVKKLRRRIRKNSTAAINLGMISTSIDASSEIVSQENERVSRNSFSIMRKARDKFKACNLRVRFFGVDSKEGSDSVSSKTKKKMKDVEKNGLNVDQSSARKSGARSLVTWQPTLTSISENYGVDD